MGKRRANGEGSIYTTIQKNKRKKFLSEKCNTCKNCKEKCNRKEFERCDKCISCTECLKYCDRYYCYKTTKAQVTINNERKSVGTAKNIKEAKEKKDTKSRELNMRNLIKNGDATLSEAMRENINTKLKYKQINENSYLRNLYTIKFIEDYDISKSIVKEITFEKLQDFFSILVKSRVSQSYIEKIYYEISQVCRNTELSENFKRNLFVSGVDTKIVTAFTVDEEKALLQYIDDNENTLINSRKCNIDNTTIKNLIKFCLAFATRIRRSLFFK